MDDKHQSRLKVLIDVGYVTMKAALYAFALRGLYVVIRWFV